MQWAVGRLLAVPLWLFALFVAAYMFVLRIAERIGLRLGVINSDGSGVDSTQLPLPKRLYLYGVPHRAQGRTWSRQVQT